METKNASDILKEAILLEERGRAFYANIAAQTKSDAVRRIFTIISQEEEQHIRFLSDQFRHYKKYSNFSEVGSTPGTISDEAAMKVLTVEVRSQISAAGYEAAAIGAAMDFEAKAVEFYASRTRTAEDPNEKALYSMLSEWEREHHKWLARIDRELREEVWYDNNFWPF